MNSPYKRLVFYFYGTDNFKESLSNIVHFNCLKHYSKIFDESIICISLNDDTNEDLITRIQQHFSSIIKSKILIFKTYKNNTFGEVNAFKSEIIDNLSKLEGLTFFAHNKGLTNIDNPICDNNSVIRWICGSYFYNLEFIDEVEHILVRQLKPLFYGSYLTLDPNILNRYHAWYAGTFYWLNTSKIAKYCESQSIEIPIISDRFYAELFPGNIVEWNSGYGLGSHDIKVLYPKNLYINSKGSTDFLGTDEDNYKFNIFLEDMTKEAQMYRYTILTYNFGDYELLREVENPQNNIEYVCITDRTDLQSNTWRIVYDKDLEGLSSMEKVYQVRYNCFKYCSTNLCVKIDSSIQILDSIDKVVEDFEKNDKRIAVLVHPRANTIGDEYKTWLNERNLPIKEEELMLQYSSRNNFDINSLGIYEVGFMIVKKDYDTLKLNEEMLKGISYFKEQGLILRVDQILFSIILNNCFRYLNVMPLSHSIIQSDKLRWMIHGSEKYICTIPVTSNEGYLFNNLVKLYNWE